MSNLVFGISTKLMFQAVIEGDNKFVVVVVERIETAHALNETESRANMFDLLCENISLATKWTKMTSTCFNVKFGVWIRTAIALKFKDLLLFEIKFPQAFF